MARTSKPSTSTAEKSARIALAETPRGLFLPGGGQDRGESLDRTLRRESREECGLEVEVEDLVGVADEMTFVPEEGRYCRKRCSFFRARAVAAVLGGGVEAEHSLTWLAATTRSASSRTAANAGRSS